MNNNTKFLVRLDVLRAQLVALRRFTISIENDLTLLQQEVESETDEPA